MKYPSYIIYDIKNKKWIDLRSKELKEATNKKNKRVIESRK